MERMKFALEKTRSTIQKSQDNMTKYYNQYYILILAFKHGDKMFLDSPDIYTTHPSTKLSHHCFRPYIIEKQVRSMSYCLKLPPALQRLYLVFHIVKLTTIPKNSISRRHSKLSLNPVIINREEEWEVEKILDSC